MDEAISLLRDFIHQIGVSFDRFIFCCGNHDRLRYLKKTKKSSSVLQIALTKKIYSQIMNRLPYSAMRGANNKKTSIKSAPQWSRCLCKLTFCCKIIGKRCFWKRKDILGNTHKYSKCKQSSKISQNSPESIPLLAGPEGTIRHKVYQSCVVSL